PRRRPKRNHRSIVPPRLPAPAAGRRTGVRQAGHMAWHIVIGVAVALAAAWAALIIGLLIVRPAGPQLRDAVRILPDLLRLIRRLAADPSLPRGVRVRLGLLMA